MKTATCVFLVVLFLQTGAISHAQTNAPATAEELGMISKRGRALAEYDEAARLGTDAVIALRPDEAAVRRYLARKTKDGWAVVFGRLSEPRTEFLISYEASARTSSGPFVAIEYRSPKVDTNYFLRAALATDTAFAAFGTPQRPYNVAAIPTSSDQWWVYLSPAPTQVGVWPLGGDVRYSISTGGTEIRETRTLHKTIIENPPPSSTDKAIVASLHTHILSDTPEDTDVFQVLIRQPSIPDYVLTPHFMYKVETNGVVHFMMTREEFQKKKKP